ncbi:MAG: 23S rRNA (guanosine(2251)-2'-O)-methyltransferase RlmB [Christensenellales bacterium]|jgi:23S rRNA (guanosine2251-2'-O)-methyltransferase
MIISGKNSVFEAIKSGTTINKISILKQGKGFEQLIELAKQNKIRFEFVDKAVLDKKSSFHQGIVAEIVDFDYSSVEDILQVAQSREEDAFVLILDGIEDPHNFGAIIRSAECAGVHGIIILKNRQIPVNDTVVKTSAGAIANMKIARVTNLSQTIDFLKEQGLWVYACEAKGESIYKTNLKGPVAIIIGSEGFGISALTLKKADAVVSLPLFGKVNSLNASVACGISLYEVLRQRNN